MPVEVAAHVTIPLDTQPSDERPQTAATPGEKRQPDPPHQDEPVTPADTPAEDKPEPAVVWDDLLKQTLENLQNGDLEEAAESLAKLKEFELELTDEQTAKLAATESDLDNRTRSRRLRAAMEKLASDKRADVQAAQNRLYEDTESALPLLRESVHSDNPLLVRNSLDMLHKLKRPDVTLPIILEVLKNPDQQENWGHAIRQIELSASGGAGKPLLELALSSNLPAQRVAALRALASVVDPPRQTAATMLPTIFTDGPELTAALLAAGHAICVHHQHDLWSGRALAVELSPERLQQIYALPERLSKIMATGGVAPARAAKMLAIATRQIPAEPLPGVRVLAFGAEMDSSRAAAVLDGVWDSATATTMWRYQIDKRGSIVFDLGGDRYVAGVRIWNLNESGGAQRGWKDVAVYVGSTPTELLAPAAKGVVPPAPGKKGSSDYSVTVPVNFARGRYVRLRAENTWSQNSHSGLTEVQILGFQR